MRWIDGKRSGKTDWRRGLSAASVFLSLVPALSIGGEDALSLSIGGQRESSIRPPERHLYLLRVEETPLFVHLEQRGINLVLTAEGPGGRRIADADIRRWGAEVLLLEDPGSYQLEVRVLEAAVAAGEYVLAIEGVAATDPGFANFAAMSRAGQAAGERSVASRQLARGLWEQALRGWRLLGERRWQAECLDALGSLAAALRDHKLAIESFSESLTGWQQLGEPARQAASLNELGVNRVYTGELALARQAFGDALVLWRQLGAPTDVAQTGSNFCALDQRGGALSAARACYEENLERFRQLGDAGQELRLLNALGGVYDAMGEPDAALTRYEEALKRARTSADRRAEAQTLNNLAVVHRALGEWQQALELYARARVLWEGLEDRFEQGVLLANLGVLYNELGQPERARSVLEESLVLRRAVANQGGEIITLNHLGSTWKKLGNFEQAFSHHRQALELASTLGNTQQQVLAQLLLAELHLDTADATAALQALTPALEPLARLGLGRAEARAHTLWGRALASSGRGGEAREVLAAAVERWRQLHDRAAEAEALGALAAVERTLGLSASARGHVEDALKLVESLRVGFLSPSLRASFLATQRSIYSLSVDLEMDRHVASPREGWDGVALELAERGRARSLLDALYSRPSPDQGVPRVLLERRQTLRRRLSALADQRLKERGKPDQALERSLDSLAIELDGVEAAIRSADPRYASATVAQALGVEEMLALLEPGTVLMEFALGPNRSYLWVLSPDGLKSFVLPAEREIEELARPLYQQLSTIESGTPRWRETAVALSQRLLAPAWAELGSASRLVVVPDGVLHYLPFAALPDPVSGQLLLERFEISYLPSATALAGVRAKSSSPSQARRRAAIFADPLLAAGSAGPPPLFESLPASRREAEAIATLAPAEEVWLVLGEDASRESVLEARLDNFRVLHFATHALAEGAAPELSGLLLSLFDAQGRPREGLLTLPDIYGLRLGGDLVVLSGCGTGLGRELRGEGLMGFARAFLHAGSPRVVASLWRVEDRASAELMRRFYRAYWQQGLPPAAALASAQRQLARDPRYRAPYSWASFILQGEWR